MNEEAFRSVQEVLPRKGQPSIDGVPISDIMSRTRVTTTTALPPMEPLLRLYDTPCFFRGELVALGGRAKSGKTTFLSIVMAVATREEPTPDPSTREGRSGPADTADTKAESKDAIVRERDGPLKVLWVDTEQSAQSTQDILVNRIIPLAERGSLRLKSEKNLIQNPTDRDDLAAVDQNLFAYNLRGYGYEARRSVLAYAIGALQPDLVIIDGIKDLITDINDAVQATLVMEQLMALAQAYKCCIVNVLHMNKNEADKNMRGSIGTELTNKAFEVFQCEYMEESDVFSVKHALSRKERCRQKMYYQLDKDAVPVWCDAPSQPRDAQGRWVSTKASVMPPVDLRKLFTQAMEGHEQRPYGEVMAVALKKCGVVDAKAYYTLLDEAERQGIVRKVVKPGTGVTYVEYCADQLPF